MAPIGHESGETCGGANQPERLALEPRGVTQNNEEGHGSVITLRWSKWIYQRELPAVAFSWSSRVMSGPEDRKDRAWELEIARHRQCPLTIGPDRLNFITLSSIARRSVYSGLGSSHSARSHWRHHKGNFCVHGAISEHRKSEGGPFPAEAFRRNGTAHEFAQAS